MHEHYRDDLAYIHDEGFGHIAESGARELIDLLRARDVHEGTVVELGCGSGISSRILQDAGYSVVGFDLSESMISRARRRVPEAEFHVESFVSARLPQSVAVTAIGEVFSYLFDPTNRLEQLRYVFRRVADALQPGGVLLFDMAEPDRAPAINPTRNHFLGSDWAVLVDVESSPDRSELIRKITSFRKMDELYRRDDEVHRLQLIRGSEILQALESAGFEAQMQSKYRSLELPKGLTVFPAVRLG